MSAEILEGRSYSNGPQANPPVHDSIHDLESFFWVLVHTCLTRKGPGPDRRDELVKSDPDEDDKKLRHMIHDLFDADDQTLLKTKHRLFDYPGDLNDKYIRAFHPYFCVLGPLVVDWWNVLRHGYFTLNKLTPGIIHRQVIELIEKTIADHEGGRLVPEVESSEEEKNRWAKASEKVEQDRAEDRKAKAIFTQADETYLANRKESPPVHSSSSLQSYAGHSSVPPSKRVKIESTA